MSPIELNKRQDQILKIVKENGPITGEQIAERLNLTRATLRPDLAILTMAGFLEARPRVGYYYSGNKTMESVTKLMMGLKVKDFQSDPVVIDENMSVYEAILTIFSEDVGTLYVVDKNEYLQGVLSRKDLLRTSIGQQELSKIPVHIIMTRMPNIVYCSKNDSLILTAKKLIEHEVDSLPVVTESNNHLKIVGRLTKTNITKAFISLAETNKL